MSKNLSEALIGVPSLSPTTGMKLVEMVSALQKKAKEESCPSVKKELLAYSKALNDVCFYSAIHQTAVLGVFAELIKKKGV